MTDLNLGECFRDIYCPFRGMHIFDVINYKNGSREHPLYSTLSEADRPDYVSPKLRALLPSAINVEGKDDIAEIARLCDAALVIRSHDVGVIEQVLMFDYPVDLQV